MRLLIVSSDPYPATRVDVSVLFGGELAGRGHEIDLILQSEAACARPYVARWAGGRVWVGATDLGGSLWRRVRKHVRGIVNDCRVFSRLRLGSYDIVEVKDKFLSGIFALIASRWFKVRFVYWLSYPFAEHYLQRARDGSARYPFLYVIRGLSFDWLLYRVLLPAADHVFVQSEQMRADVAARGIPWAKLTAVPMGVSLEMCATADRSSDRRILPPGIPCVVYLGTLSKVRRLEFLIGAFARVHERIPQALLYLVGRGDHPEDEAFLEQEVDRRGLRSAVIMPGQFPRDEALRYVQEADVCVSPFHPAPILLAASPTKLVEYMALGKAVVANDHPDQRRVIDESDAGLCVPYEQEAFATAVVRLLEDPATAKAMGERGRRYVIEHRAYGVIADTVERRMADVISSRS